MLSYCIAHRPQAEKRLVVHHQAVKQAEVSLCAAVSGAAAAAAPAAGAPHDALDRELASIEAEQTERLQPDIARLEASLRLIVGPFDVAALERLVLPVLRGFGGEVRAPQAADL